VLRLGFSPLLLVGRSYPDEGREPVLDPWMPNEGPLDPPTPEAGITCPLGLLGLCVLPLICSHLPMDIATSREDGERCSEASDLPSCAGSPGP